MHEDNWIIRKLQWLIENFWSIFVGILCVAMFVGVVVAMLVGVVWVCWWADNEITNGECDQSEYKSIEEKCKDNPEAKEIARPYLSDGKLTQQEFERLYRKLREMERDKAKSSLMNTMGGR